MNEQGFYICDFCRKEKEGEPKIVFVEGDKDLTFCGRCCFANFLSGPLSEKWKLRVNVENPRPYVCGQCGKEYEEEKIVFRFGSDVKQFHSLNCFYQYLNEALDVLVVKDFSLIHKSKEKSARERAREIGEEVARELARTRR